MPLAVEADIQVPDEDDNMVLASAKKQVLVLLQINISNSLLIIKYEGDLIQINGYHGVIEIALYSIDIIL